MCKLAQGIVLIIIELLSFIKLYADDFSVFFSKLDDLIPKHCLFFVEYAWKYDIFSYVNLSVYNDCMKSVAVEVFIRKKNRIRNW